MGTLPTPTLHMSTMGTSNASDMHTAHGHRTIWSGNESAPEADMNSVMNSAPETDMNSVMNSGMDFGMDFRGSIRASGLA